MCLMWQTKPSFHAFHALNGNSAGFVARRGVALVADVVAVLAILSWLVLLVLASQNGFAICVVVVVNVLSCW